VAVAAIGVVASLPVAAIRDVASLPVAIGVVASLAVVGLEVPVIAVEVPVGRVIAIIVVAIGTSIPAIVPVAIATESRAGDVGVRTVSASVAAMAPITMDLRDMGLS
jgi:hypothetical protein